MIADDLYLAAWRTPDLTDHLPRVYCQGKTRSGKQCQQPPMANGLCAVHGGKPGFKYESSTIKAGADRMKRYMPTSLIEMYETARLDENLLELEDDIALLDTRTSFLLMQIRENESIGAWERIREIAGTLVDANRRIEASRVDEAIGQLEEVICLDTSGHKEQWAEIQEIAMKRKLLVESQRKRQIELERMIPVEAMEEYTRTLLDSVRRNLPDDSDVLTKIQADFQAAISGLNSARIISGSVRQLYDTGGDT